MDIREMWEKLKRDGPSYGLMKDILDALEELETRTEALRPKGEYFDGMGNLRDRE